jgi:hypothetical protein
MQVKPTQWGDRPFLASGGPASAGYMSDPARAPSARAGGASASSSRTRGVTSRPYSSMLRNMSRNRSSNSCAAHPRSAWSLKARNSSFA